MLLHQYWYDSTSADMSIFQLLDSYTGAAMKGRHFFNVIDCMIIDGIKECKRTTSRDGMPCLWCQFPQQFQAEFGNGTCMVQPLKTLGCPIMREILFDPINDVNIKFNLTSASQQARCLLHSKSECNESSNDDGIPICAMCELPDVYGLKPESSLCLPRSLVSAGGCEMLQNIPPGAKALA